MIIEKKRDANVRHTQLASATAGNFCTISILVK